MNWLYLSRQAVLLLMCLLTLIIHAKGQGSLTSVQPSIAMPGETVYVVIRGSGTLFRQNNTIVNFGQGLDVIETRVENEFTLVAGLKVQPNASLGSRTVQVKTGDETMTLPDGFEVIAAGGTQVEATLQILPIESIALADLNFKQGQNAPLFITVDIHNDNQHRDLMVRLRLVSERYGPLAEASERITNAAPNATFSFDNRDFDTWTTSGMNNAIEQAATQTGTLPSDVIRYKLEVYDVSTNSLLDAEEGSAPVLNLYNRPEAIRPGRLMSEPAPVVVEFQPLFQWFSWADQVDFALYPVYPAQQSGPEVVLNRPVFEISDFQSGQLLYPLYAELLQPGRFYAWQVVAKMNTPHGTVSLPSEVYWFRYEGATTVDSTVEELTLRPDNIELEAGESYIFIAEAYNFEQEKVEIKGQWSVVPKSAGTVTSDGVFTAGPTPGYAAVIVKYGPHMDYITVRITKADEERIFENEKFIENLFGIE